MHQLSTFIIHIYTFSRWNIYAFTLFIYVLLLICSPLAVFLIYLGRFAFCVFLLLSYSFFSAHLVEKSSRELMMEAGGKEKENDCPNSKLLKDFLLLDFFVCVLFTKMEKVFYLHSALATHILHVAYGAGKTATDEISKTLLANWTALKWSSVDCVIFSTCYLFHMNRVPCGLIYKLIIREVKWSLPILNRLLQDQSKDKISSYLEKKNSC